MSGDAARTGRYKIKIENNNIEINKLLAGNIKGQKNRSENS